jgi:hypothetical protein
MMRSKFALAAVAALVLVIGGITVAFASSSGRGSAGQHVQVIRLVARGVQETSLDLGKKGFSQGDQEVVALNLFRVGKKIGEAGNLCQFVRVTKASATDLCQVGMSLPAGQITAQGLVTSTPAGPVDVPAGDHRRHGCLPDGPWSGEDHRHRDQRGADHGGSDPLTAV